MPVVQIDWTKIKANLDDVTAIYALTHRQAALLLGLSEQLTWQKTFRLDDYDWSDKDLLDADVADLQRNLTMPTNLSDIIQYIDEIEELLRGLQEIGITGQGACCGNTAPISEEKTLENDDYPTTPPAYWGDEPVTDSDDWQQLVCGAAHAYVDLLTNTSDELEHLVTAGALVVGAIAGILALLSGAGILLAVGYGTAATITSGVISGAILGTFGSASDDLEAARDEIVCAITHGDEELLSDAIETTVSGLAWSLWFQHIDYSSAWATMVDGFNQNGSLPVDRREDCDCEEPLEPGQLLMNPGWEEGTTYWTLTSPWEWFSDTSGRYGIIKTCCPTSVGQGAWVSPDFTIGAGITQIRVIADAWDTSGHDVKVTAHIYRKSDDALIASPYAEWKASANTWGTRIFQPYVTVVSEETYYLKLAWIIGGGGGWAIMDWIKVWEVT
jgi:hypothetical protein